MRFLLANTVFADVIKGKDQDEIIRVGPKYRSVLLRDRETQGRREVETRVMEPQAKECQEPPEVGRGGDPAIKPSEGARPRQHLGAGLLASRTVRE